MHGFSEVFPGVIRGLSKLDEGKEASG